MIICNVTSSSKNKVYENLKSVIVPASSGKMEIRSGHAEAFILLGVGIITLKFLDGDKISLQSLGGECHVKDDKVIIVF